MTHPLPNYLRPLRRRTALSQTDVAHLLGHTSPTSVLRHEDGQRTPTLDTALAYAAILRVDVSSLFAGHYEDTERDVRRRARQMLTQSVAAGMPSTRERERVRAYLAALIQNPNLHYVPWPED